MTAKILVVDDEKLNRLVVEQVLIREGFEVLEAEDGSSALSLAAEEKPELMDLPLRLKSITGNICPRRSKFFTRQYASRTL
ncbi:MAG: response regulator [Spirochaetaceae bacterium]